MEKLEYNLRGADEEINKFVENVRSDIRIIEDPKHALQVYYELNRNNRYYVRKSVRDTINA